MITQALLWIALCTSGAPQDRAPDLVQLLRGDREALARIVALGETAIPELARILQDPGQDGVARFMAANVLGDIGSAKAVEPLIAALGDPFYNLRRCAALALGKIRDPRAKEPLEKLAENDPFVWKDPDTGFDRYLVREDAQQALDILAGRATSAISGLVKEKETFLEDASNPPPSPVRVAIKKLPFPFPGGFADQNVFNNYQQPTDDYVHAGLDILQPPGTEVHAVQGCWVAAIATNYPDWKTHHFFIVTPQKDGETGWCYTHVDPDTYTFQVGDEIRSGQVLGKVVDFYVGKNKGADHLHLHYVRFERKEDGTVDTTSLVDPLLFFDWKDTEPPVIADPIRFLRAGTNQEFLTKDRIPPKVSGDVDVLVGISDTGIPDEACNWMVPVVTIEIRGQDSPPWRKLVLDQRGEIAQPRAAPALYVKSADAARWLQGAPAFPPVHLLVATHTDGDGAIEPADALQAWRTDEITVEGQRRFPDGLYDVTIRAWDLQGNRAERTTKVRVENRDR
jgi:hypothetical protein